MACAFGIAAAWPVAGFSQEITPALKAVLEQAKKEGEVRLFMGSPRLPQSAADGLSKAFQQKFGFPLNVKLASLGAHPPVVSRFVAESKIGIPPTADLFPTGEQLLEPLRAAGAVAPTDWAALGVPKKLISEKSDGILMRINARTVIYNTKLVKPEDIPHRYEDLLDPKWKGKIVASSMPAAFTGLAILMGEDKAYDFARRLVNDQKLSFVSTFSDIPTKVANGEFAIGYGINANTLGHVDNGAPVANAPLEKVWGNTNYAVVLKNVKNPNAARAFGYFVCCTPEGQRALYDNVNDGTFDTPNTELNEIGGNGRGVGPSFKFSTQDDARIGKKMTEILSR